MQTASPELTPIKQRKPKQSVSKMRLEKDHVIDENRGHDGLKFVSNEVETQENPESLEKHKVTKSISDSSENAPSARDDGLPKQKSDKKGREMSNKINSMFC